MASHPVSRPAPSARAARAIALAVTPAFTLMTLISLPDSAHVAMGHAGYDMSVMYALMALAHLPAWLSRGCRCG